jgi:anti-sigma B factor antagonist
MESTESVHGGVAVIALRGEIDLAVSPRLRELLQERVEARCPALVLDMAGVEYIDSSGLATLVEYCRSAREFGGSFGLAGLRPRVRTILEIVRLHEFLPLHADVAEAVRAAGKDAGGVRPA